MAAHHFAVEQQHRNVHTVAAQKLGVSVHIEHLDRRQRQRAREAMQLYEHVLAELAVAPLHDAQAVECLRLIRRGQCPGEPTASGGSDLFTDEAMKRTVAGGTSPTAVTLWPSMTVEKADAEPTLATPPAAC